MTPASWKRFGRRDDDGVELAEFKHRLEIVERLAAEIRRDRLGPGEVGIEDGDKCRAVAATDRRRVARAA